MGVLAKFLKSHLQLLESPKEKSYKIFSSNLEFMRI